MIRDLESYFLYFITHDDLDARFYNNLNILFIYIKYKLLNIYFLTIPCIFKCNNFLKIYFLKIQSLRYNFIIKEWIWNKIIFDFYSQKKLISQF